jgi:hypothetical protein
MYTSLVDEKLDRYRYDDCRVHCKPCLEGCSTYPERAEVSRESTNDAHESVFPADNRMIIRLTDASIMWLVTHASFNILKTLTCHITVEWMVIDQLSST